MTTFYGQSQCKVYSIVFI